MNITRRETFGLAVTAAVAGAMAPVIVRAEAHGAGAQVTAAQKFRVGDMVVTALSDGYIPFSVEALQGIDKPEFDQLVAGAYQDPTNVLGAVNAYVIEKNGETWMVDAGTGPVFGPTLGKLPEVMAAVGIDPAAVSKLFVTHLHGDHIGGMLSDGAPTFANAEVFVTSADRDFWTSDDIRGQAPEEFRGMFDLAKGVLATYGDQVTFFDGEATVAPGVIARPLPGHTAGHTGYMLDGNGASLMVWADLIHVPAVQLKRPEVTIMFDTDQETAAKTRAMLMSELAGSGQMIAGMHMAFPGIGFLESDGAGYAFVPAPWQYF